MRSLALSACAVLAATGVAAAAPRPVCNLVVDPRHDTTVYRTPVDVDQLHDPGLDIVSADIATSRTHLTVVTRVVKVEETPATSPYGVYYRTFFTVGGVEFNAVADLGKATRGFGVYPTEGTNTTMFTGRNGTGVVDPVRNEIRVTVPLSVLAEGGVPVKRGMRFTGIEATSLRHYGGVLVSDLAPTTKVYTAETPSCVRVG